MLLKKQMGMTLIEVLIAAIILFMAIGLVSSAFQQSIMLQQRVSKQQERMNLAQWIKPIIEFELGQGKIRGSEFFFEKKVSWEAKKEDKKQFVDSFSDDEGYVAGRGYVSIYLVDVHYNDTQLLQFKKTIWSSQ